MFRSRRPPPPGAERWVYPKIFTFVAGAALGLAGMASHTDWLITAAVVVLALGFAMRFMTRERNDVNDVEEDATEDT